MLELYKGQTIRQRATPPPPAITICRTGQIALSAALLREIGPSWQWAQLWFDADTYELMIKLVREQGNFAYRISRSPNRRCVTISGSGFCRWFGIDYSEKRTYCAHYDSSKRGIIVDLAAIAPIKQEATDADSNRPDSACNAPAAAGNQSRAA